jgi:hypothetical protein
MKIKELGQINKNNLQDEEKQVDLVSTFLHQNLSILEFLLLLVEF